MCNVQLMKKNIYIFHVYHIRIIAKKTIGSHDMKQTYSSIIIVRNVCVLISASMIVIPPHNKVVGGYTGFTMSVRLAVRPSVDKSYVVR